MADVLVERIAALSADDKAHFHESLQDDSQSVVVQSTFDLPKTEQNAISSAVKKAFTSDRSIEFKTAPDLICGIELLSKSYKVSWSIMDYLNSLEKTVSKAPKAEHAG
jgi:F-type H+-transporting ATPase subunit b